MGEYILENFPDIYAFRRALSNRPLTGGCGNNNNAARNDPGFYGMSYFEALDCLSVGLPSQDMEFVQEMKKFSATTSKGHRTRTINHYDGYAPNVPAAIIGLPKSMKKRKKTPVNAKIVTIIYSMGARGDVAQQTITKAGLTALQLVYSLENSGYRVNLYACVTMAECNREIAACVVKLKDAKQPLNVAKVSFSVGHCSMFRRLGFRWRESHPGCSGWPTIGATIYDHGKALETLQKMGIPTNNAYYLNVKDCEKSGFDPIRLAESIGIKVG